MKTQTDKLKIVREVVEVIDECIEDGMDMCTSWQVYEYLNANYDYDRAEATELYIGALLIHELELLND